MKPMNISEEEIALVKSAVMLPIVLDTIEVDINKLKAAGLKTPDLYISFMKLMQDEVMKDIKTIRIDMRKRGIKILTEGKVPNGYRATYLCRGYEHSFTIGSNIIKSIVEVRIAEMLGVTVERH